MMGNLPAQGLGIDPAQGAAPHPGAPQQAPCPCHAHGAVDHCTGYTCRACRWTAVMIDMANGGCRFTAVRAFLWFCQFTMYHSKLQSWLGHSF